VKLYDIYEPIQQDLQKVEQSLAEVADIDTPALQRLLEYVIKSGGKRIRPALTLFSGRFYNCNPELLLPVATATELLHTATLVHDDIIDDSVKRRGKATINKLWGNTNAVLVGDYLLAKCTELAARAENIKIMELFSHTVVTISSGELRQKVPSLDGERDDYFQWIAAKTASLFSAAAKAGAILADSPKEAIQALSDYGYNLGMSFQVMDDILDFVGDEVELGKPQGSDLTQGVLTLPTIVFLEHHPDDDVVRKVLAGKVIEDIEFARVKICQPKIIQECFDIAHNFSHQACQALEILPNKRLCSHLADLAYYVVRRER
jgi:geranylgeranyl pyrophosphate synthase